MNKEMIIQRYQNLFQNLTSHLERRWKRYVKYFSVIVAIMFYIYIVYWIDNLASIELVITWFPDVII